MLERKKNKKNTERQTGPLVASGTSMCRSQTSSDTEPEQGNKMIRCKSMMTWKESGSSDGRGLQVLKGMNMINFWVVLKPNFDAFYRSSTCLLPCWEESERADADT